MRLIDADSTYLQDAIGRNGFKTRDDIRALIDRAPTVNVDAIIDGFTSVCPSGCHHDYRMVAIGSDEVGDRVNTYRCSKCGEKFDVKFVT